MRKQCTTHHDACACREAKYVSDMAILKAENAKLREALEDVTNPKFMPGTEEWFAVRDAARRTLLNL